MNRHDWAVFYYWCLGLGFIFIVLVVCLVAAGIAGGDLELHSPFGPVIRMLERRQQYRYEMAKLRLRADLIRHGADAGYIRLLEERREDAL